MSWFSVLDCLCVRCEVARDVLHDSSSSLRHSKHTSVQPRWHKLHWKHNHIYCSNGEGVQWDVWFVTQLLSLQRHVVACVVHVWLVIVYGWLSDEAKAGRNQHATVLQFDLREIFCLSVSSCFSGVSGRGLDYGICCRATEHGRASKVSCEAYFWQGIWSKYCGCVMVIYWGWRCFDDGV